MFHWLLISFIGSRPSSGSPGVPPIEYLPPNHGVIVASKHLPRRSAFSIHLLGRWWERGSWNPGNSHSVIKWYSNSMGCAEDVGLSRFLHLYLVNSLGHCCFSEPAQAYNLRFISCELPPTSWNWRSYRTELKQVMFDDDRDWWVFFFILYLQHRHLELTVFQITLSDSTHTWF